MPDGQHNEAGNRVRVRVRVTPLELGFICVMLDAADVLPAVRAFESGVQGGCGLEDAASNEGRERLPHRYGLPRLPAQPLQARMPQSTTEPDCAISVQNVHCCSADHRQHVFEEASMMRKSIMSRNMTSSPHL